MKSSLLPLQKLENLICLEKDLKMYLYSDFSLKENRLKLCGFAKVNNWINLQELDLSFNQVGIEGEKVLASSMSWINLIKLYSDANKITGCELAKNTSWRSLEHLNLANNIIQSGRLAALKKNTSWECLEVINLSFTKVKKQPLPFNDSWNLKEFKCHNGPL